MYDNNHRCGVRERMKFQPMAEKREFYIETGMSCPTMRKQGRQERFCEHPRSGVWLRNCIQPTATRGVKRTDRKKVGSFAFFLQT